MLRKNFPRRKALRRKEALERNAATLPQNRKAARKRQAMADKLGRTITDGIFV